MGRPSTIPENLVMPLLTEWEKGKTANQLVDWLKQNHNISFITTDAGVDAINRRIKKVKDIELQAKRDAISKAAAETAIDYIGMISKKIYKLDAITDDYLDSKDKSKHTLAKGLLETQLKYIDKQTSLMGMDNAPATAADEDAIVDGLIAKLGK